MSRIDNKVRVSNQFASFFLFSFSFFSILLNTVGTLKVLKTWWGTSCPYKILCTDSRFLKTTLTFTGNSLALFPNPDTMIWWRRAYLCTTSSTTSNLLCALSVSVSTHIFSSAVTVWIRISTTSKKHPDRPPPVPTDVFLVKHFYLCALIQPIHFTWHVARNFKTITCP